MSAAGRRTSRRSRITGLSSRVRGGRRLFDAHYRVSLLTGGALEGVATPGLTSLAVHRRPPGTGKGSSLPSSAGAGALTLLAVRHRLPRPRSGDYAALAQSRSSAPGGPACSARILRRRTSGPWAQPPRATQLCARDFLHQPRLELLSYHPRCLAGRQRCSPTAAAVSAAGGQLRGFFSPTSVCADVSGVQLSASCGR